MVRSIHLCYYVCTFKSIDLRRVSCSVPGLVISRGSWDRKGINIHRYHFFFLLGDSRFGICDPSYFSSNFSDGWRHDTIINTRESASGKDDELRWFVSTSP